MKTTNRTQDFGFAGSCFNLAGERGEDPDRILRERREAEKRQREAAEFQAKMQRRLEECPGFIGGSMPTGPGACGSVVIEPECIKAAMPWLKARFRVNCAAGIESTGELRVQIAAKAIARKTAGVRIVKASFEKPVQFTLELGEP